MSIKFEVIPDTARAGVNFVVSSNVINFGNGETTQPLPVSVVNTLMPQPELKFFIRLLNDSVTGEAVVGDGREMVVVIERSWDAAGVFGEHSQDWLIFLWFISFYFKALVIEILIEIKL